MDPTAGDGSHDGRRVQSNLTLGSFLRMVTYVHHCNLSKGLTKRLLTGVPL